MDLDIQLFDRKLIKISLASTPDFFEIKHFLKQHKESSASRNDLIYTVRYQKKLVGLARLIPIEDAIEPQYWLRGLYIEADFRQLRLATHLLDFIASDLKNRHDHFEIFAFPFVHLLQLYKQNDYKTVEITDLPINLQKTYQNALKQGKSWLCMALIH